MCGCSTRFCRSCCDYKFTRLKGMHEAEDPPQQMQTEGTSLHAASGCTVDKGSDRLHADPQAYHLLNSGRTHRPSGFHTV